MGGFISYACVYLDLIRPFTVPIMHRCIWRPAPNLHYIYTKFLMDLWDYTGLSSGEKCILCGNTVRTWQFGVWRWENLTQIAVCLVCYWAIIRGLKCLTTCQNALECARNVSGFCNHYINSVTCQFTNDFLGKTVSFPMVYLVSCQ